MKAEALTSRSRFLVIENIVQFKMMINSVRVATRGVEPRPLLPSLFGPGRCSTDELCGRMCPIAQAPQ